jgi:isocitrate dehydrogenase
VQVKTANPSGLLEGAVMMLNHIGQTVIAEKYKTLGLKLSKTEFIPTIFINEGISKEKVGTKEFAEAVISNLDKSHRN